MSYAMQVEFSDPGPPFVTGWIVSAVNTETQEVSPIQYAIPSEDEALLHASHYAAVWNGQRCPGGWCKCDRQTIIRVDGEIGEELGDEAPSYTRWQRDADEAEQHWLRTG